MSNADAIGRPPNNEKNKTIQSIIADCEKARTRIKAHRAELEGDIFALENPPPPQQPSAADDAEVDKLDTAMDALLHAEEELLLDYLMVLNSSAAVTQLKNSLVAVNSELKAKVEDVNAVAKRLTKVADTIKVIDGIVNNLTKLAALIP